MRVVVDPKQFWQRLEESQLLNDSERIGLWTKYQSETNQATISTEKLEYWLVQQSVLTPYQIKVLLSDGAGQLRFGNYILIDILHAHQPPTIFSARHRITGHSVKLTFFGGSDATALLRWQHARKLSDLVSENPHPNIVRIHEAVAIPEYRWVVSELPRGNTLEQRVPINTRVPIQVAWSICHQLASVSIHLKELGVRVDWSGDRIWLDQSALVRVECPLERLADPPDHCQALAQWLFRLVTGQPIGYDSTLGPSQDVPAEAKLTPREIARLQKLGMINTAIEMMQSILNPINSQRPDMQSLLDFIRTQLDDDYRQPRGQPPLPTLSAYDAWLKRSPLLFPILDSNAALPLTLHNLDTGHDDSHPTPIDPATISLSKTVNHEFPTTTTSQRARRAVWVPMLSSLILLAGVVAVIVLGTHRIPHELGSIAKPPVPILAEIPAVSNRSHTPPETQSAEPATVSHHSNPIQVLIDDDRSTLWESPTWGPPVDFSFVPHAPRIALSIRLAELLPSEVGQQLLAAFGPVVQRHLQTLQDRLCIPLTEIQHLLVTLHANEHFKYEPFYVVTLTDPHPLPSLLNDWNHPQAQPSVNGWEYFMRDASLCFALAQPDSDPVSRFLAGPAWLIQESLALQGANTVSGTLKQLAAFSDQDRHLSVFTNRAGLFDDAGQKLMGDDLAWFNRRLSLALEPNIRGMYLSLHLQRGTYLELKLDRNLDLPADALRTWLIDTLPQWRDEALAYVSRLEANPYWDRARQRYGIMLTDVLRNIRVGIEHKQVVSNAWLPPAAAHNLVAATELVLAFGEGPNSRAHNIPNVNLAPRSLQELLATPRSFVVSTNSDLFVLLQNLQQEILDEYGSLPFHFEIRLQGHELSAEGITQNQRPGVFELHQQPLSAILTEIMVRANPDTNISGPSDPDCKLVWALADDPDAAGKQLILVTTRTAAIENNYNLPGVFVD